MLDFSLDLATVDGVSVCTDSIDVRGKKYRRMKLDVAMENGENTVCWVEGIGPNYSYWATPIDKAGKGYSYMKACYDNGVLVFSCDDFETAPFTALDNLSYRSDKRFSKVYGIDGKTVSVPQHGVVYISNGRKWVFK